MRDPCNNTDRVNDCVCFVFISAVFLFIILASIFLVKWWCTDWHFFNYVVQVTWFEDYEGLTNGDRIVSASAQSITANGTHWSFLFIPLWLLMGLCLLVSLSCHQLGDFLVTLMLLAFKHGGFEFFLKNIAFVSHQWHQSPNRSAST